MRRADNVILAAEIEGNILPHDLFRTQARSLGNIFAPKDSDGALRRAKAYSEFRDWHPVIKRVARGLDLDLSRPRLEANRIHFPYRHEGEGEYAFELNPDGSLRLDDLTPGVSNSAPRTAYSAHGVWNLGIELAARLLNLDLTKVEMRRGQIVLRGPGGIERRIPVDQDGFFHINWCMNHRDQRFFSINILNLIRADQWRNEHADADAEALAPFNDKLVVVGSTGTGNNVADLGTTPLDERMPLVMTHLNVANSIITGRFIHPFTPTDELLLIVFLGGISALLTWKLRPIVALSAVARVLAIYVLLGVLLFLWYQYWLPFVLPVGGLALTHGFMATFRVRVEQKERQRIKSVFSKIVSPKVVNELLKADEISVSGARRRVTVYFADIRGFTRVTDESHAQAEAYIRTHHLPPATAEAYLDAQAREVLTTVNLYLSAIADTIIKHNGTLDKYIGDCAMAFWGAPAPSELQAVDCARTAIDAQRAIYQLNFQRAAENARRETENKVRAAAGKPALPLLTLLSLGSGINTGIVTVGLVGSDVHGMNYTVFGREVNLASRLEGVSGRGRIIISDTTYLELGRLDPELAATCIELPPREIKGFRDPVNIYEVRWREMDTETQEYDTGILTARRVSAPRDIVPKNGAWRTPS